MRRLVIRFKDGSTTSLDLVPGREREDPLRHLLHFPGKEVGSVERPRKLWSWEVRRWVGIPMRPMAPYRDWERARQYSATSWLIRSLAWPR